MWLASCRRGAIPFFSVSSVISVVQNLVVPAAGRAVLICEICGSLVFACGHRPRWAPGGWIQALSCQFPVLSPKYRTSVRSRLRPIASSRFPFSRGSRISRLRRQVSVVGSR